VATRLVVAKANGDGCGVIADQVDTATVENLLLKPETKDQEHSGIVFDFARNCRVTGVHAAKFGRFGIWMRNNSFLCTFESCTLAGNRAAALRLEETGNHEFGSWMPTLVANCMFYGGGKGLWTKFAVVVNVVGCMAYQTGDVAFCLEGQSNSLLLSGCRTYQITGNAIEVTGTHELNLTGNIFCWHTGHGIVVRGCNWGTITGNNVIDTGSWNKDPDAPNKTVKWEEVPADIVHRDGIQLFKSQGFTVSNNALFNWHVCPEMRVGIFEDDESRNNIIANNNVNYYLEAAVESHGAGSVAKDNVGYGDLPYQAPDQVKTIAQSFNTAAVRRFIDMQTGDGEDST